MDSKYLERIRPFLKIIKSHIFTAIVIFFPFLTFYFSQYYVLDKDSAAVFQWIAANPSSFAVNYFVLLAFLVLFSSLLGSFKGGTVIYTVLSVVIIFANVQKTTIQTMPLLPWDLYKISEAIWALQFMYNTTVYVLAIVGIVLTILGLSAFLFFRFRKNLHRKRKRSAQAIRFLSLSLSAFFLISAFNFWQSPANAFVNRGSKGVALWDQVQTTKSNGLFLSFILNRQYMTIDKAQGYSSQSIKQLSRNIPLKEPEQKPTVIMIMSEAFWDLTNVPGLTFTTDPLPTIHALRNMGQSFYMASTEKGGGTCNVEFEALTGLSNTFLPAGSMAYTQYINKKTPALPWYFKKFGYATTAIHPYLKSFWNRDKVYPNLGFDHFYSMDDMPDAEKKGTFISDKSLSQQIIKQYEKGGPQQFIFAVSMQNHFPYYQNYYKNYTVDMNGEGLTFDMRSILRCYTQGIHDADAGLNDLIEYFGHVDTPVNIIFYGDHFPSLSGFTDDRLNDGEIPSFVDRNNPMINSIKYKFTPVAFWSNYGAKIPECDGKEYSALSYSVLEYAGLPLNSYYSVLKDGFTSIPVLQKNLVIDSGGQISENVPEAMSPIYNTLDTLNYDSLFGNRYVFDYLWDN